MTFIYLRTMRNKKISFKNTQGVTLSGKLELPAHQHPKAYAIFAHCFTCNKSLSAIRNIARALTQHGFGLVRFDFTGLGESEGDFSNTNFSSNIQDLEDVARFMEKELEAPKLIIGHSLGGAAAIFSSKNIPSIQAVVTIGAPASPKHVQHLFEEDVEAIKKDGSALVNIGGRIFPISKQFIDDISAKSMNEILSVLKKPLLIMHSPQDTIVGINNAADIYANSMHPKSFISLDGANHLLANRKDSLYAGNVIAEWASGYINTLQKKALYTKEQVVVSIGKESYTTDILAAGHRLVADEPEEVGGNNFGPAPYDYLLSSLGACTAMTLRMYADRKKWDLEKVVVHLTHGKLYAEDRDQHEKDNVKIDNITKKIELHGQLDEVQKKRLIEIADKCPVHKTLHNPVKVNTVLIE